MDLVHHNSVRGAGVRHFDPQHSDMHLQIMEETTGLALPRGVSHGDLSRGWPGFNVYGSATRFGRRPRCDADELCVLRTRTAR